MSQLPARSRLVCALVVSAGLLHCGGDGDAASPMANAGGDAGGDNATAGAPLHTGGDDATAGAPPNAAGAPAAAEPAIPTLNGCKDADYVDLSADEDARTILIAAEGLTYSPRCMIVSAAQTVSWQGSLSAHPLAPGNPADAEAGSPDNPIPNVTSGSSVEVTFPAAGTYPYHCQLHSFGSGQGMAGAVHVRSGS